MDKESPILVRVFKEESELEVWKQDRTGRFALLKTYPICRWSGELGPKIKEGDRQAPEGFYTITPGQMNPNSQYYLSFDLGYPNAFDRAHGRTGAQLMVHGDCSSRGCYSMTDEQISEIYALGRDAFFGGQKSFQVQAYPFRMTPQNLAKHRNNPHLAFWKMLKKGNDHFEVTRLEPKVNVCEKRYVFDAQSPGDPSRPLSFSAPAKCPVYEVDARDRHRRAGEAAARRRSRFAELVRRNVAAAPIKTNADGGMHPVFVAAVKRNQIGVAPSDVVPRLDAARNHSADGAAAAHSGARRCAGRGRRRPGGASERRGGAAADGDCRTGLDRRSDDGQARRASSAACSRRSRRPRPRKPSPPRRRATARSTAWRGWSACARTRPNPTPPNRRAPRPSPPRKPRRSPRRLQRTARSVRSRPTPPVRTAEAQGQAPAPAAAAPSASSPFPPPPAPQRAPPPPMAAA